MRPFPIYPPPPPSRKPSKSVLYLFWSSIAVIVFGFASVPIFLNPVGIAAAFIGFMSAFFTYQVDDWESKKWIETANRSSLFSPEVQHEVAAKRYQREVAEEAQRRLNWEAEAGERAAFESDVREEIRNRQWTN